MKYAQTVSASLLSGTPILLLALLLALVVGLPAPANTPIAEVMAAIEANIAANGGTLKIHDVERIRPVLRFGGSVEVRNASVAIHPDNEKFLYVTGIASNYMGATNVPVVLTARSDLGITGFPVALMLAARMGDGLGLKSISSKFDIPVISGIGFEHSQVVVANVAHAISSAEMPPEVYGFHRAILERNEFEIASGGLYTFNGLLRIAASGDVIPKIGSFLPDLNVPLLVTGEIASDFTSLSLAASLEGGVKTGSLPVSLSVSEPQFYIAVSRELTGVAPSGEFGIRFKAGMKLPGAEIKLLCAIAGKAESSGGLKLFLQGSSDGEWRNAFGIPGMTIRNVTVGADIAADGGIPNIGVYGAFAFGDREVEIAASVPAGVPDLSDVAFLASVDRLTLRDAFDMYTLGMGGRILPNEIPLERFEIRDVRMSFSRDDHAEVNIARGVTQKGELWVFDQNLGATELNISADGVILRRWVRGFQVGPLELSARDDGRPGPFIDLALKPDTAYLVIQGRLALFGGSLIEADVHVARSLRVYLSSATMVGLEMSALLEADPRILARSATDLHENGFLVRVAFQDRVLHLLESKGTGALRDAKERAERDINRATTRVRNWQGEVDRLDANIGKATDRIKDGQRAAEQRIDEASRAVRSLEGRANRLEDRLHDLTHGSAWSIVKNAWKVPIVAAELGAVRAALGSARGVLDGVRAAASNLPAEASPEVIGLMGAKAAADAGLVAATKALEGAKEATGAVLDAAAAGLSLLRVDRASAEFRSQGRRAPASIDLAIEATVVGSSHTGTVTFDLADPAAGAASAMLALLRGHKNEYVARAAGGEGPDRAEDAEFFRDAAGVYRDALGDANERGLTGYMVAALDRKGQPHLVLGPNRIVQLASRLFARIGVDQYNRVLALQSDHKLMVQDESAWNEFSPGLAVRDFSASADGTIWILRGDWQTGRGGVVQRGANEQPLPTMQSERFSTFGTWPWPNEQPAGVRITSDANGGRCAVLTNRNEVVVWDGTKWEVLPSFQDLRPGKTSSRTVALLSALGAPSRGGRHIGIGYDEGGRVTCKDLVWPSAEATWSLVDLNGGSLQSGDRILLRALTPDGAAKFLEWNSSSGKDLNAWNATADPHACAFRVEKVGGPGEIAYGDRINLYVEATNELVGIHEARNSVQRAQGGGSGDAWNQFTLVYADAPPAPDRPSGAGDLAMDQEGNIWVVASTDGERGAMGLGVDFNVYFWSASKREWSFLGGGASAVATGSAGTCWVLDSSGNLFSYNGAGGFNNASSGTGIALLEIGSGGRLGAVTPRVDRIYQAGEPIVPASQEAITLPDVSTLE